MFTNLFTFNFVCIALVFSSLLMGCHPNVLVAFFFLVLSFVLIFILFLMLEGEFIALILLIAFLAAIDFILFCLVIVIENEFSYLSKNISFYFISGVGFIVLFFALVFQF